MSRDNEKYPCTEVYCPYHHAKFENTMEPICHFNDCVWESPTLRRMVETVENKLGNVPISTHKIGPPLAQYEVET